MARSPAGRLALAFLVAGVIHCGCDGRGRWASGTDISRRVGLLRHEYARGYPISFAEKAHEVIDTNAAELTRIGAPAIPALLKALEDQTPTRCEAGYGKIAGKLPGPNETVRVSTIRVSDKANWILERITGQGFMFDSDLPLPERRMIIAKWRKWWEQHHREYESQAR